MHSQLGQGFIMNTGQGFIMDTMLSTCYGVATVSRIDKIIGLFCKRDL